MEHLPHLINSVRVDSGVAVGIKARTKTIKIINEKIGPYVTKKIGSPVTTTFFSIIIDETLDVSTKKMFSYNNLRYYSFETKKVCDSFLGLVELDIDRSAAGIYEVLRGYLVSVRVNLENLTGFAADDCVTMLIWYIIQK